MGFEEIGHSTECLRSERTEIPSCAFAAAHCPDTRPVDVLDGAALARKIGLESRPEETCGAGKKQAVKQRFAEQVRTAAARC